MGTRAFVQFLINGKPHRIVWATQHDGFPHNLVDMARIIHNRLQGKYPQDDTEWHKTLKQISNDEAFGNPWHEHQINTHDYSATVDPANNKIHVFNADGRHVSSHPLVPPPKVDPNTPPNMPKAKDTMVGVGVLPPGQEEANPIKVKGGVFPQFNDPSSNFSHNEKFMVTLVKAIAEVAENLEKLKRKG